MKSEQMKCEQKSNISLDQEIQNIANKIKCDVEKELNQAFKTFNVLEHHCLKNENDPNQKSYAMKVQTDDNNQSHLKLRTTQKDSFSGWLTDVDEFLDLRNPFRNHMCTFDPLRSGFNSIQNLANNIKHDVEKELNRNFKIFDVEDYHPILTDNEHTSYYLRMKTDDNGHVRVKTIKKIPGSDWKTHVEEYNRGKACLEGKQKKEEKIEDKPRSENLRAEQKGKQTMEVEQNPDPTSIA